MRLALDHGWIKRFHHELTIMLMKMSMSQFVSVECCMMSALNNVARFESRLGDKASTMI